MPSIASLRSRMVSAARRPARSPLRQPSTFCRRHFVINSVMAMMSKTWWSCRFNGPIVRSIRWPPNILAFPWWRRPSSRCTSIAAEPRLDMSAIPDSIALLPTDNWSAKLQTIQSSKKKSALDAWLPSKRHTIRVRTSSVERWARKNPSKSTWKRSRLRTAHSFFSVLTASPATSRTLSCVNSWRRAALPKRFAQSWKNAVMNGAPKTIWQR